MAEGSVARVRNLLFVNDLYDIVYVKEAADAIDRATKAPKRKATKGTR